MRSGERDDDDAGGEDLSDWTEIDEVLQRLESAGWAVHVTVPSPGVWIFGATNGANRIRAEASIQVAAWQMALEQAKPHGILGRIKPGEPGPG